MMKTPLVHIKSKVSSLNISSKISALTNFTFSILFFFANSFPRLIDASVGSSA